MRFFAFVLPCYFLLSSVRASSIRASRRELVATVTELRLIDANTDREVLTLVPNSVNVINLQALGIPLSSSFNIKALVTGDVAEVAFDNGKRVNKAPYARCTVKRTDFKPCSDLKYGYSVTVTATARDSAGTNTSSLSATVAFVNSTPSPTKSPMVTTPTAPAPAPTVVSPTTPAPTATPISSPVSTNCKIPQFVSAWEESINYPLKVTEAQGGVIGNDLVVIGGFNGGFTNVTEECYALDTSISNAQWRKLDDIPVPGGLTHAGTVVVGTKLYMCGGYIGAAPGPETDICLVYDHKASPGKQWSFMPKLPYARGGGGMVYSAEFNSLTFSSGSQRPYAGSAITYDYTDTWTLSLANPSLGWSRQANIPYHANHVGYVTAYDELGRERHFFLGGHEQQNKSAYVDFNYEWDIQNGNWVQRASMLIPGGHFSSSTRAVGCGFVIAGGSTNSVDGKITNVYYYDIPSDSWTFIGNIKVPVNTPVCDFGADGYFYCETGAPGRFVSHKARLEVV